MNLHEFKTHAKNQHISDNHISMIIQYSLDEEDLLGAFDILLEHRPIIAKEITKKMQKASDEKK